jgi:long-chain acyl-CoA synthetase
MRPYCVALVTLNKEETIKWAERNGIPASDWNTVINNEKIISEIQKVIDSVNSQLASFETIKKFGILPDDFTIEDGSLTPTMKVKRRVIMQRYKDIIDEMYVS